MNTEVTKTVESQLSHILMQDTYYNNYNAAIRLIEPHFYFGESTAGPPRTVDAKKLKKININVPNQVVLKESS